MCLEILDISERFGLWQSIWNVFSYTIISYLKIWENEPANKDVMKESNSNKILHHDVRI